MNNDPIVPTDRRTLARDPVDSNPLDIEAVPSHLLEISDKQWAVWKWICLRGSGFPAQGVAALAAPRASRLADELLALDKAVAETFSEARDACRSETARAVADEQRKRLSRSLKQIQKGRVPELAEGPLLEITRRLEGLLSKVQAAQAEFSNEFSKEVLAASRKLRGTASDPMFQQAVSLQNRSAIRRVASSFLRPKRGFKERQNEEMIASYLQRYCLKNDTIGFFGPVGWARFSNDPKAIDIRTGRGLIADWSIFFENWCIEALAEKFAQNRSLRPWMKPRLLPFIHIEENRLHSAEGPSSALSAMHAALLRRCTGELTARELAHSFNEAPRSLAADQVYRLLEVFAARGIISWKFEVPLCLRPEQHLRRSIDDIEDNDLKGPLLYDLDELEGARRTVAKAFGSAERLDAALQALDETFTRLTGKAPTKSAGSMYASRTLIYQDCRRDAEIKFGADIVSSLGKPLSLLLAGARWFSRRSAALYRIEFQKIYDELLRKNRRRPVDLVEFWSKIEMLIFDPEQRCFNQVVSEFQSRWEQVLNLPPGDCRVKYASDGLMPRVLELFDAPGPGWRLARYHSPDVMIAAADPEAIQRGDYFFVLGEVHMTTNTQRFSFALSQHPFPDEQSRALAADFPESHVLPVPPRRWPRVTNRTTISLVSPNDYYLEIASDAIANAPRSQVLPIASLVVKKAASGLVIEKRDGTLRFDVIEFIGEILSGTAVEMMKIIGPRRRAPRITIDRLVVARESWSFFAGELAFANHEEDQRRFLEARRWMAEHGMPRHVFVRVPVEVKPFYLDFNSPVYVEIFCKMVRRMRVSDRVDEPITVTEMLPGPDQLWLRDSAGLSYTSELRIVAKDLSSVMAHDSA